MRPAELGGERLVQGRTLREPFGAGQAAGHGNVGGAVFCQVVGYQIAGQCAPGGRLGPAGVPAPRPDLVGGDVRLTPVTDSDLVTRAVGAALVSPELRYGRPERVPPS